MTGPSIFDAAAPSLLGVDFDDELLNAVHTHWLATLLAAPERDRLLSELGLREDDAVDLGIGLSDRSLGLRIPSRQLKAGRLLRARLEALGVFRESGHEAFRGCLVVPVRREDAIIAIYGQRLDDARVALWASGLPGGIFEAAVSNHTPSLAAGEIRPARCVVTTSMRDALAVYGALRQAPVEELADSSHVVLAPARPKGYATSDVRSLARRSEELVLLGRGAERLASRLLDLGITPAHVRELDLAQTLVSAASPPVALAALVSASAPKPYTTSTSELAPEANDEPETGENNAEDGGVEHRGRRCTALNEKNSAIVPVMAKSLYWQTEEQMKSVPDRKPKMSRVAPFSDARKVLIDDMAARTPVIKVPSRLRLTK